MAYISRQGAEKAGALQAELMSNTNEAKWAALLERLERNGVFEVGNGLPQSKRALNGLPASNGGSSALKVGEDSTKSDCVPKDGVRGARNVSWIVYECI
jgi:hypothetical protein